MARSVFIINSLRLSNMPFNCVRMVCISSATGSIRRSNGASRAFKLPSRTCLNSPITCWNGRKNSRDKSAYSTIMPAIAIMPVR